MSEICRLILENLDTNVFVKLKEQNLTTTHLLLKFGIENPQYAIKYKDGNITESKFFILPNKKESEFILQLFSDNKIIEYLELCKYSGFNSRIILDNVGYN